MREVRSLLRVRMGAVVGCVAVWATSCVFSGDGSTAEDEARARTVFEDLISRGSQPTSGLDDFGALDGNSFEQVEREYADDPPASFESAESSVGAPPESTTDLAQGEAVSDELDALADLIEAADAEPIEPDLSPYIEFGQNIIWYPLRDGDTRRLIMKPFTFPAGSGAKIFDLLKSYGNFEIFRAIQEGALEEGLGPQPQGTVLLDLRPGFSVESFSDPREAGLRTPEAVALSDVLFVTATASDLREVEHFIDLFAADVRQIEIEAKIVEVTTREALDLGVRPVNADTPVFGLPNPGGFVNGIDFSFANTASATEALFQLGAVFDGVTFNAILEAVASFENVSIISRPKVAVREGARADIVNVTRIPFYNVSAFSASGVPTTTLAYEDVGVQMYVIPRVVGRDTVILNIDIEASQQTGSAVTFNLGNSTISVPQISKRNARTIVRLEPGQAVILGGLISERTVERTNQIPLLGDIPILGNLFRNKLTSKEKTNVLFFIRPRILEGIDLNSPFE